MKCPKCFGELQEVRLGHWCHYCKHIFEYGCKELNKMDKTNLHERICKELIELYRKKNADYGDSFHESYLEDGMTMVRIRLGDKWNRFKQLSKSGEQRVKDESIRDALLDMANYAIMAVIELDLKE